MPNYHNPVTIINVDADGNEITDSKGNPASNVVLADGAAVGPAVTVPAAPLTNDECFKIAYDGAVTVELAGASSSANTIVAGDIIRCYASTDCYICFDDAATDATSGSMYFSAGTELIRVPAGCTHISALKVTTAGTLYITKVE